MHSPSCMHSPSMHAQPLQAPQKRAWSFFWSTRPQAAAHLLVGAGAASEGRSRRPSVFLMASRHVLQQAHVLLCAGTEISTVLNMCRNPPGGQHNDRDTEHSVWGSIHPYARLVQHVW